MLKIAKPYENEIQGLIADIALDPYYKWWTGRYIDTVKKIDEDFWANIQMVSVDTEGKVIGYFGASIARAEYYINNVSCINFYEGSEGKKVIFAKDLLKFINFLVKDQKFKKINWTVFVGNPVEAKYDRLIKKYGGRIVGVFKNDALIGGEYYDSKHYEWINDYFECTHCGHRNKFEAEAMCWRCEVGKMIYHNPFGG